MRIMNPEKLITLGKAIDGTVVESAKSGRGSPFIVWNENGQAFTVASLTAKGGTRLPARDRKTAKEPSTGTVVLV